MNQSSDIDAKVERLKKKYLEKTPLTDAAETTDHKSTHRPTEKVVNTGEFAWKSPTSRCYYREIKSHNKNLQELLKAVTHFPLRFDSEHGLDESDDVLNTECTHSMSEPNIQCTETDVTLPSNFRAFSSPSETEHLDERPKSQRQPSPYSPSSASGLGHVYQELLEIYEKLQVERLNQQQWAAKLLKQEQKLEQRENLLLQHQETLHNVCGVQGEVHGRIRALQQQHQMECEQLNFALKEKTKDSKRLKSSFVTIKDLNESMKKQLTDLGEQKKKLEDQLKKVQARLQNLQRKYDYAVAHKGQANICPKIELKPSRPDKTVPAEKLAKIPGSSTSGKLLALLLDWVLDSQLVQTVEGDGKSSPFLLDMPPSATSLHERCAKTLPVLTEQLQQVTETNSPLQLLLLKVSYWSLRQLDQSSQTPLTSTLRRLGEEMTKGSVDPSVSSKSRPCPLFKTPCLHTRFLSTLIILKTISQVDTLAQALEALLVELRTEEGQALFLHYQALPVVSALLRGGSPGLLASALDVLMLMCGESWMQTRFLEACSTEDFFRTASLLLRNPRLELPLLEKVAMLLQRLSAIRKNKRLFEAFSLHLVLQEKHRTVDPSHTFLRINLSSILFNLGMLTRP